MKKYGGINAVAFENIQEAEICAKPQTCNNSNAGINIVAAMIALPVAIIKLLPITLLLMLVMYGFSCLILWIL
ncbi:hypothetical protein IKW73_03125 [Candidatus Saccharibacteria bacterium]|nr:hypothetical protein [Candidatus Saccharibacteria bacterium]